MKHLFIVNPKARRLAGRVDEVVEDIRQFFLHYPQVQYEIHVTRWRRDAEGFSRRYVNGAAEIVRVYAVGGMGTFFEVINGVAGMPNVQVTLLPFGIENSFLLCFGRANIERFTTLKNLVFSQSISFDLIRCGNKFGMGFCLIGVEAMTAGTGKAIIDRLHFLPCGKGWTSAVYFFSGFYYMAQRKNRRYYRIDIDGNSFGGEYLNILIANQPYYGAPISSEARPDDGFIDVYVLKPVSFYQHIKNTSEYVKGYYTKWPQLVKHYRGKRVSVTSDMVMSVCLDGEMFFDMVIQAEIVPHAVDFAKPVGVGFAGRNS